jgi:hypothetical protein
MEAPRHTAQHIETWRRDGGALIPNFFTPAEVAAVVADFQRVFGAPEAADAPLVHRRDGLVGSFNAAQFKTFDAVPFDCSPALNLIGVHPALVALAREALGTEDLHLYQCQAWAKFTGAADYDQPFHCDYLNHTLVAPSEDARRNSVVIMSYFTDVTEAHGPMHYVPRPDSDPIAGPEATLGSPQDQAALHHRLAPFARSTAAPAGSIFPYTIDLYHRGTNLTAPQGHRYAVTACFKRRGDDTIGYHAWPFHLAKPWRRIFAHATPEQLACFGVHPPGDPYWTKTTLARAQARYPEWNLGPYRDAMS